ncbi:hypothetical protein ANCDUO_19024 [Ancylostoma duodenale]|uniref:Uncharacterized protein n=1 Tax=Ancylostoma duodenale TaxID=51022 RepID=A0A0C2FW78_9BILA|nr:hypothetical protein ANCDUO_19024 [Ancylostoma duodenale]
MDYVHFWYHITLDEIQGRLRALDQAHECVSQEIDQLDKNVDKILDQINSTFQVYASWESR